VRSLAVAATAVFALVTSANADVLHLRSGATVRTSSWWLEGDELRFESPAGVVGIPRSELVRVEPSSEAAPPPSGPAPAPARSPAEARSSEPSSGPFPREAAAALRARDFETASRLFLDAVRDDADDALARVGYAASEIALGRDALALGVVLEGLARTPEVAQLHELLGDLLDRQERVEDALAAWREAFRRDANDRVREKILKGEREVSAARGLSYTTTAHFTVRFDGSVDDAVAEPVVDWLEDRYSALARRFRHYPEQPITVLLYPEREFRDVTRAPEWVGGLYDGKIRVPLGGLRRVDAGARAVLVHELTHAFVHDMTRGNAPRWLHEGLAQVIEERPLTRAERVEVAERVARTGPTRWDADGLSYPAALSLVRHLLELRGESGVLRVLASLGDGVGPDEALTREYGLDYAGLCESWARALGPARTGR